MSASRESLELEPAPSPSSDPSPGTLFSKLKWLIFVRILLATALFGSAVVVQIREGSEQVDSPLIYTLIIGLYGFSALYALVIKKLRNLTAFAYVQFFFDALFITPLIFLTGGVESIFSFLYFLTIISASYLLYTPGAFFAATMSGGCYAALVALQAAGFLPSDPGFEHPMGDLSYVFYNITINVFAFFLVAFLSSYLAEQLRRTREALIEEHLSLQELEEFNRKIVENIQSGIMTIDPLNQITFLNSAARRITGLSIRAVFGAPIDKVFPGASAYLGSRESRQADLVPLRWEQQFSRGKGPPLHLGFALSPLLNPDGQKVGNILIFEDQTRIKYLEEKANRDNRLKTIGRLAAGIAHEIRNPLASISGSIQVLQAELEPTGENRTLMDIVVRETDRLNGLITDFLQYVRQQPVTKRPVDLEQLIYQVLAGVRINPRFKPEIEVVVRCENKFVVEADPSQLEQVFWNLLLNAVDAIQAGGRIEVVTRDIEGPHGDPVPRVRITVSDTGPGIDPSIVERIFDPFFSTKPGGTGLGLAMAEKIIQAHDGLIRVGPGKEAGTMFSVILPAQRPLFEPDQAEKGLPENVG